MRNSNQKLRLLNLSIEYVKRSRLFQEKFKIINIEFINITYTKRKKEKVNIYLLNKRIDKADIKIKLNF